MPPVPVIVTVTPEPPDATFPKDIELPVVPPPSNVWPPNPSETKVVEPLLEPTKVVMPKALSVPDEVVKVAFSVDAEVPLKETVTPEVDWMFERSSVLVWPAPVLPAKLTPVVARSGWKSVAWVADPSTVSTP